MRSFLKHIFNRKKDPQPPFDLNKYLSESLETAQAAFQDDAYILFGDFFYKSLLPALKDNPYRNLITGTYSMTANDEIGKGKTASFTPKNLKQDDKGDDILFAYDCYVPVTYITDGVAGMLNVVKFYGRVEDDRRLKPLVDACVDALEIMTDYAVPKDNIDTSLYDYHQKGEGLNVTQSAYESGPGFDFVMRPR